MFFCPNCKTIFDIKQIKEKGDSDDSEKQQSGGKPNDLGKIIENISNGIALSAEDINEFVKSKDLVVKTKEYKQLDKDKKEYVMNALSDFLPKDKLKDSDWNKMGLKLDVVFSCNNCGFNRGIEPMTLLYEKGNVEDEKVLEPDDYSDMIYDNTLLRDRKYTCVNSKCPSHKDFSLREAVVFREHPDSFVTIYVCVACKASFKI